MPPMLSRKNYKVARTSLNLDDIESLDYIPDEKALDPMNPAYSCVTCGNTECVDFGRRFASCPEHIKV